MDTFRKSHEVSAFKFDSFRVKTSHKLNPGFKAWNTTVKLLYGVPRSTFTYLVEGHLAGEHPSLRNQILSRYPAFFRKLLQSPNKEVRVLAIIVSSDPRLPTC